MLKTITSSVAVNKNTCELPEPVDIDVSSGRN